MIVQTPFFSIIVPVYKVEKYIMQCVNSILDQTFSDYELILVDDGSPDSCPLICDQLKEKNSKIIVIHKQNGGVSSARNLGLKHANGKYVCFVDSDDYYGRKDALQVIKNELDNSNADVLILKAQEISAQDDVVSECKEKSSTKDILGKSYSKQLAYCVSRQLFDACPWNKVFRRDLIFRQNLYFTEGIIAEDIDWAARLALTANSLAILYCPVYTYRKGREGSATSSLSLQNIIDTKGSIERCINYPEKNKLDDVGLEAYYSYIAYRYIIWMAEAAAVKDNKKKKLIQLMKKYDWLLKYKLNNKVKMVYVLYHFWGYKITSEILRLYLLSRKK